MEIEKITDHNTTLVQQQEKFLDLLRHVGLPSDSVFAAQDQRIIVFGNSAVLVNSIPISERSGAVYVSKFFAAVSAGLFDAALNYIWDETVTHLRKRIAMYDIEYFYDNAVSSDKRKELKTVEDLSKLSDDELLRGAKSIDLISDIGYRKLDLVRFMRNNASSAHPNQNELTGLSLIAMADDCIREVVSTPIPPAAIEVQKLLKNIKEDSLNLEDARHIAVHFQEIGPIRTHKLVEGLFGIFYKRETSEAVRDNIRLVAPLLWPYVSEQDRKGLGIKHAYFAANNNLQEAKHAKEFLSVVGGLSYETDDHRAVDISVVLDELKNAHWGMNNFYNEVLPAKKLRNLISDSSNVPNLVEGEYVKTLVDVFISNGYGVCTTANEIYIELIKTFSPKQSIYASTLILDDIISSKLYRPLCDSKFIELIKIISIKISGQAGKELINKIALSKNRSILREDVSVKELARKAMAE